MRLLPWSTMLSVLLSPSSALSPVSMPTTTTTKRSLTVNNNDNNDLSGKNENNSIIKCDVLVLGAGAAGIAAARELVQQGRNPIVLEARNRVGGRAHTSDELGVGLPLDHGARWLHGASSQNRIVQLLEEQSWTDEKLQRVPSFAPLSDTSESSQSSETMDDVAEMDPAKTTTRLLFHHPTTQQLVAVEPNPLAKTVAQDIFATVRQVWDDALTRLGKDPLQDATLQELLLAGEQQPQSQPSCWWETNPSFQSALPSITSSQEQDEFRTQVQALVHLEINQFFDNWEGAPIDRVSALHGLEGTMLGGGNALLSGGYGRLVEQLAKPLLHDHKIRLQHEIVSVQTQVHDNKNNHNTTCVQVLCRVENENQFQLFEAPVCIVALPLGVLKSNQIPFDPPLPSSLQTSIDRLGVAIMNKVELSFPYSWWQPGMERFTLACSHLNQGPSYHPWTSFIVEATANEQQQQQQQHVLVCYLHGDFAQDTERKSNDEIQAECMDVLRRANLATNVPDPLSIHVTRWFQDPHSRGSWTYYAKNSGAQDARNFRENVDCHQRGLYFCGEHTCDGSIPGLDLGCVHGAWLSGELAAAAAVQQMQLPVLAEVVE